MPLAAPRPWLEAPPKEKPELLAAADEPEAKPKEGVAWLLADRPSREYILFQKVSQERAAACLKLRTQRCDPG